MARIEMVKYSQTLKKENRFSVFTPFSEMLLKYQPPTGIGNQKKYRLLWLLHGMGGNHKDWFDKTDIESFAIEKDLIIVAPDAGESNYADMANGEMYFTYITEELYSYINDTFPVKEGRLNNWIAGNSMGGYGALKAGLRCPEKYSQIFALSGGLDRAGICEKVLEAEEKGVRLEGMLGICDAPYFRRVFGRDLRQVRGSVDDCFALADRSNPNEVPFRISLSCGMNDGNLMVNRKMYTKLNNAGYNVSLYESPGGHEWHYWQEALKGALKKGFDYAKTH